MYDNLKTARRYAKLEENPLYFRIADIFDRIIVEKLQWRSWPLHIANLGGGAHTDTFARLFELVMSRTGSIDWVDNSPSMLQLANEYMSDADYQWVTNLILKDIYKHLEDLEDQSLDCIIMKFIFSEIEDSHELLELVTRKLKNNGFIISDMPKDDKVLKSYTTNARNFLNGESFPLNETRELHPGDKILVKFFNISWDPESGHTDWIELWKYYRSRDEILQNTKEHWLQATIIDRKTLTTDHEGIDADFHFNILIAEKR